MSFTGGGMGRRGACTLKRRYPTRYTALVAVDRLVARGAYGPAMEVRRCRYGRRDHWHVMHRVTKGRKGRRQ